MPTRARAPAGKTKRPQKGPAKGVIAGKDAPSHYRLGPSSASRWLCCPYSAQHDLPNEAGPAAKAGTIAHEHSCAYLKGEIDLLELEDEVYSGTLHLVGDRAKAIAQACATYVEHVGSRSGAKIFETKIEHASIPDFGGTIDAAILDDTCLSVDDLKTGKWKVSPENNPQLMSYLCLARQLFPQATTFQGTIIQPLVYKRPKTATFTKQQLDVFEKLVAVAGKSDKIQSGEHCLFCPLLAKCDTGKAYAIENHWPDRYRHIEKVLDNA